MSAADHAWDWTLEIPTDDAFYYQQLAKHVQEGGSVEAFYKMWFATPVAGVSHAQDDEERFYSATCPGDDE